MPVSCLPTDIANASACYCLPEKESRGAMLYLLNQISGLNLTPKQLADNAKCYCFDAKTTDAVMAYLLCAIVNK